MIVIATTMLFTEPCLCCLCVLLVMLCLWKTKWIIAVFEIYCLERMLRQASVAMDDEFTANDFGEGYCIYQTVLNKNTTWSESSDMGQNDILENPNRYKELAWNSREQILVGIAQWVANGHERGGSRLIICEMETSPGGKKLMQLHEQEFKTNSRNSQPWRFIISNN